MFAITQYMAEQDYVPQFFHESTKPEDVVEAWFQDDAIVPDDETITDTTVTGANELGEEGLLPLDYRNIYRCGQIVKVCKALERVSKASTRQVELVRKATDQKLTLYSLNNTLRGW
jgi:hypothetical protein